MKRFIQAVFLSLVCLLFNSNELMAAKVYDCFTFFNELELLEMRLDELYPVVDHFVIVESPISYSGKAKPLYYQENAERFAKYKDKIIHIVVESFPGITNNEEKDHWHRESYSREAIMRGLKGCHDDDVIFISDLDEIPRATIVLEIKDYLKHFPKSSRIKPTDEQLVCGLDMRLFMYFMNRENLAGWYGGSKATPYWIVCKYSPWGIKLFHHSHQMKKIKNAGWHFNTMGGMDKALEKWMLTGPIYYEGLENVLIYMKNNPDVLRQSFYGQVKSNTVLCTIDSSFPKYFLENLDHFREIGWFDDGNW